VTFDSTITAGNAIIVCITYDSTVSFPVGSIKLQPSGTNVTQRVTKSFQQTTDICSITNVAASQTGVSFVETAGDMSAEYTVNISEWHGLSNLAPAATNRQRQFNNRDNRLCNPQHGE
jgi:hypothetical protein